MKIIHIIYLLSFFLLTSSCETTRIPKGQMSKYYTDQNFKEADEVVLLIAPPLNDPTVLYTYAVSDSFNPPTITEKHILKRVKNELPDEIKKRSSFDIVTYRDFLTKPDLVEQVLPFKDRTLDFNLPRWQTMVDFGPNRVDYVLFLQDLKLIDLGTDMSGISGFQPSMESLNPEGKGGISGDHRMSTGDLKKIIPQELRGNSAPNLSEDFSSYFSAKFVIWDNNKGDVVYYGELNDSVEFESLMSELAKTILMDSPFYVLPREKQRERRDQK